MNENSENLQNVLKSGSFWKNNTKAVPGRPKPRKEIQNVIVQQNAKPASSFQNFQESVNDAWDIGEDEFCVAPNVEPIKALSAINNCKNKVVNNELLTNDKLLSKPNELQVTLSSKKNSQQTKPLTGQPEIHKRKTLTYLPLCEAGCENETGKSAKFQALLNSAILNLSELRQLSWSGIPSDIRPNTWRLLAGYLPVSLERRQETLERKRHDYWNFVKQYYNIKERDEIYQDTYRQIHIDIPRMSPVISLFQQKSVQEMFERILFIWAIRHPASGYVQGINDLVTPFFVVFLQEILRFNEDLNKVDISSLPKVYQDIIEADSFWCFSKFLEGIQDNYIFAQLGIQQKVNQLKELIQRIDCTLHKHLQDNGIDYLQFSFRWMNNLLTRELPLKCSIRLWDTYLCEADSFVSLHVYVCAAFLQHWRQKLLFEKDFQGLMMLLQHLPTQYWADAEIGVIIAEAYRLKYTFSDAPRHLQNRENSS